MSDVTNLGLEAAFHRSIHRLPNGRVAVPPAAWERLCEALRRRAIVPNQDWGYQELMAAIRAADRRFSPPPR